MSRKKPAGARTEAVHPFGPVFDARSTALILGTMPSPRSREEGFYYGHPQNRFWRVLAAVLKEPLPGSAEEKKAMLLRNGVALWDVLARCEIENAADASISNPEVNDLDRIFSGARILAVFCNGGKAFELYEKSFAHGPRAFRLPSTSPANRGASLDRLTEAYSGIRGFLRGDF